MQQSMPNPEDITDPTTAMNMTLVLMAKAFKLNNSTPTNNNQRISSNPRNRKIAQPVQNVKNQNPNGNGNVVAKRVECNANGNNADLDEIEEVNANCILMANLQQASTLGTQTDKALVYDSNGSAKVQPNDNCYNNDIFNMFTQEEHVEQGGGTLEQHSATVEETRAYFESLYNNLAIKVEKVNSVNRKLKVYRLNKLELELQEPEVCTMEL
ncbi:hypothetical protein Tco_1400247 [Tanacetum coccineum]